MTLEEAVLRDPDIVSGELCFRGTRVPVHILFGFLAGGESVDSFTESFPDVQLAQAQAVILAAGDSLQTPFDLKKSA